MTLSESGAWIVLAATAAGVLLGSAAFASTVRDGFARKLTKYSLIFGCVGALSVTVPQVTKIALDFRGVKVEMETYKKRYKGASERLKQTAKAMAVLRNVSRENATRAKFYKTMLDSVTVKAVSLSKDPSIPLDKRGFVVEVSKDSVDPLVWKELSKIPGSMEGGVIRTPSKIEIDLAKTGGSIAPLGGGTMWANDRIIGPRQ